jgi:dipeptidase
MGPPPSPLLIHLLPLLLLLAHTTHACTTLVAGRAATIDGSILAAHSNDGDGDTAGNLMTVPSADHPPNATRQVHGGSIPDVLHTFAYFTKPGGYASLNEHQVGLAESTCVGVFAAKASAMLTVVDLSALAMERARTSREAVQIMGALAELHGYVDSAESLLVVDPTEAFVFQILPDDTGASAVWAAQRVPDSHVAVVANSFTIRGLDFGSAGTRTRGSGGIIMNNTRDSTTTTHDAAALRNNNTDAAGRLACRGDFLCSHSLFDVATRAGRWHPSLPTFDFTRIFAGAEPGHKYASGRRMWYALGVLAPNATLPSTYGEYVSDAPYPTTVPTEAGSVRLADFFHIMRSSYQGSPYDMTVGVAAGPFGTPDRAASGAAEGQVVGNWERSIAVVRTIVSYVIQLRGWLPSAIGATLWFAPHAAHTSCYVPFPVAMLAPNAHPLPVGYTSNGVGRVDRGRGAWQASRFVFNIAQLRFDLMILDIRAAQELYENASLALQAGTDMNVSSFASSLASSSSPRAPHEERETGRWRRTAAMAETDERRRALNAASMRGWDDKQATPLHTEADILSISTAFAHNAEVVVSAWWNLTDTLLLHYADGYCNGCGHGARHQGYSEAWLGYTNYSKGPPPSPPVPPPQLH